MVPTTWKSSTTIETKESHHASSTDEKTADASG
jgi:hypothetical protein